MGYRPWSHSRVGHDLVTKQQQMARDAVEIYRTAVDEKFLKNKDSSQPMCASGTEEEYWRVISAKNGRGNIHDSPLEGHWVADDTTIPENMSSIPSILFFF